MRIVISYRFTGEDPADIERDIGKVCTTLRGAGHDVLFSFEQQQFYEERQFTPEQIYAHFLEQMQPYDVLLAVVRSQGRSNGMRMESERADRLRMRKVMAIRPDLESDFLAEFPEIIPYNDIDSLCMKLKGYFP